VIEQVMNVSQTMVVRGSWARGQALAIHGWVYSVSDGLLRDLGMCVKGEVDLAFAQIRIVDDSTGKVVGEESGSLSKWQWVNLSSAGNVISRDGSKDALFDLEKIIMTGDLGLHLTGGKEAMFSIL
jgi:hypothetical protein